MEAEESRDSLDHEPAWGVIPAEFHSVYKGEPFRACLVCEARLDDRGVYQIHKAWRGSECIMEAAICAACLRGMSNEYSQDSMRVIRRYQARALVVRGEDRCGFCIGPPRSIEAYSKVAVCRGAALIRPVVLLCAPCEEEVHGALSQRTRDVHDDFVRDHFPGLPVDLEFVPAF